jgi:DNA modification methylase
MPLNNSKKHTIRASYTYRGLHINDYFINAGYNYRGNILRKTTSPELWANPIQASMYKYLESLIIFLIEHVKEIKRSYSIAHDKNDLNIS